MDQIINYLSQKDPILATYIVKLTSFEEFHLEKSTDYFASLCREIVGQQLSGKVADVIFARFLKLFPKQKPTAEKVLKIPDERLRGVGMSWSKVKFIHDLSEKVKSGSLVLEKLDELSNEAVAKELSQVKGIGPWTAEMFLMFSLAREDIFSFGDLGLKKAIQRLYKLRSYPSHRFMEKISKKWSPYRTYVCLLLWNSIDSVLV